MGRPRKRRAAQRGCRDLTHRGRITVIDGRLYSRPRTPPLLLGAAVTPETARLVGHWADGLLTVSAAPETLKKVVDAFRAGGGAGKPLYLQVSLNWAESEEEALQGAQEQWRFGAIGGEVNWDLRLPADFERAARFVRPEDLRDSVLVSWDLSRHAAWLQEFVDLGFEECNWIRSGPISGPSSTRSGPR